MYNMGKPLFNGLYSKIYPCQMVKDIYEDALEVADVEDLADYIFSLTGMSDLQKLLGDEVRMVLRKHE